MTIWAEKYRPTTLDDYVFQNEQNKQSILSYIKSGIIPHIMLSGVQGTGKSSLALLLPKLMGINPVDVFKINASNHTGVDIVREKIEPFVTTSPIGDFKIIILEEAETMSLSAQKALKDITDVNESTARFIFTTNAIAKLIPPLRSRCQQYVFGAVPKPHIAEICAKILLNEGITFELETMDLFIDAHYPDIRAIIGALQQESTSGTLVVPAKFTSVGSDSLGPLSDLLKAKNWRGIIDYTRKSISDDQWDDLYKFMYENLEDCPSFAVPSKWQEAIVVIAEYLYKHQFVADKQINGVAMMIRLSQVSQ